MFANKQVRVWFALLLGLLVVLGFVPRAADVAHATTVVETYDGPTGISASDQYSVTVNNEDSFVYKSVNPRSDGVGGASASFTDFSFSGGPVTVTVTKLTAGAINSVVVRPLNLGITPVVSGDTVTFTLNNPAKVSVEINPDSTNQDVGNKLFIFADPPETNVPSETDSNVVYFGPGVYDIGSYTVPSGKDTIYIAGGAYVKGQIHDTQSGSITIRGRGIFSGENFPHVDGQGNLWFTDRSSITMEGIISLDSNGYNITNDNNDSVSSYKDIKMISWRDNTDGIHTHGESLIDGLFFFGHDDALDIASSVTKLKVTNCVLWNNWGAPFMFSWVAPSGYNAIIDNNDVIHDYGVTVFLLNHGGSGNLHNFTIQNIRVENTGRSNTTFLYLKLAKSQWSDPNAPYGSLDNVIFKNIEIPKPTTGGLIQGYDSTHEIGNLVFENLKIGGQLIMSLADAGVTPNAYTGPVRFISKNYVDNWSFEDDGAAAQTPSGWSTWGANGGADVDADAVTDDDSYLGSYALRHEKASAYGVNTMQTIPDLPNGVYTLSAWVRSSGGQAQTIMEAKDYGGSTRAVNIPATADWTRIEIDNIEVTAGQATVDFYSNAGAGDWIEADDVVLAPQTPANLVVNPGFEADSATQSPTGWWEALTPSASYTESTTAAHKHTGNLYGVHYQSTAYDVYTGQSFSGLADGTYRLTAWVQSSGTQTSFLEAKDYGGASLKAYTPGTSGWTRLEVDDIEVANGAAIIGFYTNGSAGSWLVFDDVSFTKVD